MDGNRSELVLPAGRVHCFHFVRREISTCRLDLSIERKLLAAFLAIPPVGSALAIEFAAKVGQLIDSIGSADLNDLFLAQPRISFFKQLEHPLDKISGGRFSLVTRSPRSSLLWNERTAQFREISTEEAELNGNHCRSQGVSLISPLTGSIISMPSGSAKFGKHADHCD